MDAITRKISKLFCQFFISLITVYQYFFSPILSLLGCHCRFYPSCSAYAKTAFKVHSPLKSLYLIIKRVLRCNPYFEGGCDEIIKNTNKG